MRASAALLLIACSSPEHTCSSVKLGTPIAALDAHPGGMCQGHPDRAPYQGPAEALLCCRSPSSMCADPCEPYERYAYGSAMGDSAVDISQCCLIVRDGAVIATHIGYD